VTGEQLRAALDGALAGVDGRALAAAVQRLTTSYRSSGGATPPRLDDPVTVQAYAAYRMPATYAAVREALTRAPGLLPSTLLDVGGGTGAAAWAAVDVLPGLRQIAVLDRSPVTADLGRRLTAATSHSALRGIRWATTAIGPATVLPPTDLITASYLLGELAEASAHRLVRQIADAARIAVLVEPGTPAGFRRILEARDVLLAAGFRVMAPCPHDSGCPLRDGADWCHFAVRLERSALHRRVKGGALGYEDEKFCYVVATRDPAAPAGGRILRHPHKRKGLVEFPVCTAGGTVARTAVGRSRPDYRAARTAQWGDPWPPG